MKSALALAFLAGTMAAMAAAQEPPSASLRASSAHRAHSLQPSAAPAPAGAPPETVTPSAAVSYENGLLSIAAENASLQQIMDKVRAATGAAVVVPPFAERITVVLRPQPPAAALSALLEGSHLNYIVIGDASDARVIKTIQITPEPAVRSEPSPRVQNTEAAEAAARALFISQTGGDEGVWDNSSDLQSTPVAAPSKPQVPPGTE